MRFGQLEIGKWCKAVDKKELNIKKLKEFRKQMSCIQGKLKRRTSRVISIRDMDKDIILNGMTSIVIGISIIIGALFVGCKINMEHMGLFMLTCIVLLSTVFMIIIPSASLFVAFHNRKILKNDADGLEAEILMTYEASNKALKINEIRDEVIIGAIEALQSFEIEDIEDAMKYYYNSIERLGNKEFNTLLEIDSTMAHKDKHKDSMDRVTYKVEE